MRSSLASLILVAGLLGCGRPTEVVLLGASDLPMATVGAVEIVVTSTATGARPRSRCVCLSRGCEAADPTTLLEGSWPLSVGLRPGITADPPFTVELIGHVGGRCADGTVVVSQRARARFSDRRRVLLRMSLSSACLDRGCDPAGETCRDGLCVPIDFPLDGYDGDPLSSPPPDDLSSAPADLARVDLGGVDMTAADLVSLSYECAMPPADLDSCLRAADCGTVTIRCYCGTGQPVHGVALRYQDAAQACQVPPMFGCPKCVVGNGLLLDDGASVADPALIGVACNTSDSTPGVCRTYALP